MVATCFEKEIVDLTEELIRIPSTHSRPEKIIDCAKFIRDWLSKHGIRYVYHDENGVPSIAVMPTGRTETRVLLLAHFDVVEAESESAFSPRIEGGRLYGRGAIDDKYAVALSLILYREHLKALKLKGLTQKDMSFSLLLTGDEEVGGRNGVGIVSQTIQPEFFIALDGGNPNLIVTKEKGTLLLCLEAKGKAGHAARPWLAQNAFDILSEDYLKLLEIFSDKADDHWHKTMALTSSTVGNGSTNMIPEMATAMLDIRYTEHDSPDEIISSIRKAVKSEVRVEGREPMFLGGTSSFFSLLEKHSQGAVFGSEHGASDARYLTKRNIPGAIWGANGEMSQHTDDEHVIIESLYGLFDCLDSFLKETAES